MPLLQAVGYRIDANGESVVISGDTKICPEVETIADGADSIELGALAERAHASKLVLTHLIPQPTESRHAEGFAQDIRRGGYTGEVLVGKDLVRASTQSETAEV